MITLEFLTTAGVRLRATGKPGDSIMQVARAAGVPGIIGECGGGCSCGTCHVHLSARMAEPILAAQPRSPLESEILENSDGYSAPLSRLGCQVKLTPEMDGMEVAVAEGH